MIYTKGANFPYPVLREISDDYRDAKFTFSVDFGHNNGKYILEIKSDISSDFIKGLIKKKKAQIFLIVRDGDNAFYPLEGIESRLEIPGSRLAMGTGVVLQLMICAKEKIYFAENHDLNDFYAEYRFNTRVLPGELLGISEAIRVQESKNFDYKLFEYQINKDMEEDFHIDIREDVIVLVFKKEDFMFSTVDSGSGLLNLYIGMALQKALLGLINSRGNDDTIVLNERVPQTGLETKLYALLLDKRINEFSADDVENVIYKISDRLIPKFATAIGRMRV